MEFGLANGYQQKANSFFHQLFGLEHVEDILHGILQVMEKCK